MYYAQTVKENGQLSFWTKSEKVAKHQKFENIFQDDEIQISDIDGQAYLKEKCPMYSEQEKIDNAKQTILFNLSQVANDKYNSNHIFSETAGFEINANQKAVDNISNLMESTRAKSRTTLPIQFIGYDNNVYEITFDKLEQMKHEILDSLSRIQEKKWEIRESINNNNNLAELEEMASFEWYFQDKF